MSFMCWRAKKTIAPSQSEHQNQDAAECKEGPGGN
jgi:hypothetical protein